MSEIIVSFLSLLGAFSITFLIIPVLIKRLAARGIVGKDMNKLSQPTIPEMGGIGVMLGISFGIVLAIASITYLNLAPINLTVLLAGFLTIILVGLLGTIDDLVGWKKGIKQWQHALIPVFAALPLMVVKINNPPLTVPFLGALPETFIIAGIMIPFGLVYSLLIVPAGVTGASNATNMLAGMNGLEAGLGAMISATMLIIALLFGQTEAAILLAALLGGTLAFIRFNWYPAQIFGGDSLTLMVGATIAAAAIIGDMEKTGVLLLALFFVEFVFKARSRMKAECFGIPQKNGLLFPDPRGGSLIHWILRKKPMTEKGLVKTILSLQAGIGGIVIALFFIGWLG
jgi:UDP-N-acetylglucosamine--dolichyl-phosphate N-acetylglucosaminephosphotransferase